MYNTREALIKPPCTT